jgi:hypothetical protein
MKMNNLTTVNKTTALAISAGDPLQAFADAVAPQTIVGKLLRFSKGDWLADEDDEVIKEGTRLIANLDDALIGWQKWEDKKPVDPRLVPLTASWKMEVRRELGDNDESLWEKDPSGKSRDPWQRVIYVPMADEGGNAYTFTSGSQGGIRSIGKLARAVVQGRKTYPDELPIVALTTDVYDHREYGRIKKPVFTIVAWSPRDVFDKAMAAAGFVSGSLTPPASPAAEPTREDMDDDIPF